MKIRVLYNMRKIVVVNSELVKPSLDDPTARMLQNRLKYG